MTYFHQVDVELDHQAAIDKVTAALKEEGFGVLTTIDAKATLKQKIDVDFKPYTILGACNPPLAHKAMSGEDSVGILLPCNVVVSDQGDGVSRIYITNVDALFSLVNNDDVAPIAADVKERLARVQAALTA